MPGSSPDTNESVETAKPVEGAEPNADVKSPAEGSSPPEEKAEEAKGEKGDMLSAVKAALEPKEKAPDSEDSGSKEKPATEKPDADKDGEGDEGDGELTDEELSRLKGKTKKRIERLLADRTDLNKQVEAFKPKAEQFDKLVDWVRDNDLSTEEVNQVFDIAAAVKRGDFKTAYDQLAPIYRQLQAVLGEVLPDDLQQRINRGEIDEATAKRLVTAETGKSVAEQRAARQAKVDEERQARSANEAAVHAVKSAVTDWEKSKSTADPDWKLKQPLVQQAIELALHRNGFPKTAADAVKVADAALAEVNKTFTQLAPRKREVAPPVTDSASGRSQAAPKNMLEAVRLGVAKAHGTG